jgi:hypothetical protein
MRRPRPVRLFAIPSRSGVNGIGGSAARGRSRQFCLQVPHQALKRLLVGNSFEIPYVIGMDLAAAGLEPFG